MTCQPFRGSIYPKFARSIPRLQNLSCKQEYDCIIVEYITGKYGRPSARMIWYVNVGDARNEDEMSRNESSHFF